VRDLRSTAARFRGVGTVRLGAMGRGVRRLGSFLWAAIDSYGGPDLGDTSLVNARNGKNSVTHTERQRLSSPSSKKSTLSLLCMAQLLCR